jgi:ABC-2 type transport system ATP-binding protein
MIETRDLTKTYGDLYALNRLTLKLDKGDVYGFIGPNGAGKTTTMRILATLLNPSWGEASVCGYSIYNGAKDIRRVIGYMPDFFGVYDDMKVIEYLEFFAAAYRIKGPERRKKCDQVLELVDLGYKRDALVTSLSRGMTQRLGLARVLLHEPQVLLLDEPASGLDPRARIEMRGLLKELRKMGKTILVSSHILPELADICNKIGIIERGKLLFDGDVNEAIRQVQQRAIYDVKVAPEQLGQAEELLKKHPDVDKVERKEPEEFEEIRKHEAGEYLKVTLTDGVTDGSFIAAVLVQSGVKLKMLKEEEIDLEDVFMGITKGITN